MLGIKIHVVLGVAVLAQADAAALAAPDRAVLDDPALGPVRADQAVLIRRRRGPGGGALVDVKAGDGDVVQAVLVRHEAVAPHEDFDLLGIGVQLVEVGVQHGLAAVLLGVPLPGGFFLVPGTGVRFGLLAFLQRDGLIQHLVVQEHRAGVAHRRREIPVAADHGGVGVVIAEHAVVHPVHPHIALEPLPAHQRLRAGNHRAQRLLGAIDDPGVLSAAVAGRDLFAVDARRDEDLVPRHGHPRRVVDVPEGHLLRAVAVPGCVGVDIQYHGK